MDDVCNDTGRKSSLVKLSSNDTVSIPVLLSRALEKGSSGVCVCVCVCALSIHRSEVAPGQVLACSQPGTQSSVDKTTCYIHVCLCAYMCVFSFMCVWRLETDTGTLAIFLSLSTLFLEDRKSVV